MHESLFGDENWGNVGKVGERAKGVFGIVAFIREGVGLRRGFREGKGGWVFIC